MRSPNVAEQTTEWGEGGPGEDLLEERLHAYNDRYHAHVPKLADVGVIAYSQGVDMIELARDAVHLQSYIERPADRDLDAPKLPT